jgi:uncharacterized membrane protein YgcG
MTTTCKDQSAKHCYHIPPCHQRHDTDDESGILGTVATIAMTEMALDSFTTSSIDVTPSNDFGGFDGGSSGGGGADSSW